MTYEDPCCVLNYFLKKRNTQVKTGRDLIVTNEAVRKITSGSITLDFFNWWRKVEPDLFEIIFLNKKNSSQVLKIEYPNLDIK